MARKDRHTFRVGRIEDSWLRKRPGQIDSDHEKRSATSIFPQPFGVRIGTWRKPSNFEKFQRGTDSFVKGLILAQNERWRRGLGMQVERAW